LRYEGSEYSSQEEDPEARQYVEDEDVVNLDSTTKIKYSNGKELTVKFKKVFSSKSNGPQDGVTYIYYKSPLALALLTKKVGDVCPLAAGACEVLEIE
jgi:transcription elongation GreA/GreB family factor